MQPDATGDSVKGRIDRRAAIKAAGAVGLAAWTAPMLIDSMASPAAAITAGPCGAALTVTSLTSLSATGNPANGTTPSFTATNGAPVLILISAAVTGVGTVTVTSGALTGITAVSNVVFNISGDTNRLIAFRATGNGATSTVVVAGSGGTLKTVLLSVVQLGNAAANPIRQSNTASGTSGSATVTLAGITACDGEVLLVGNSTNATWTPPTSPSAWTEIFDSSQNPGAGDTISIETSWFPTAQTSATASPSSSTAGWAAIALEIAHV